MTSSGLHVAMSRVDSALAKVRQNDRVLSKFKRDMMVCLDYIAGAPLDVIAHRHGFSSTREVCRIVRKYGCPPRRNSKAKTPR